MSQTPILEEFFFHDGRGPELQKIHWRGAYPKAFEYYNPSDTYNDASLKHLALLQVQAYSMAGDEVHGNIVATGKCQAAINMINKSA